MGKTKIHQNLPPHMWRNAYAHMLPSFLLAIAGAFICVRYGTLNSSHPHYLITAFGLIVFLVFAGNFLRVATNTIYRVIARQHLTVGRAAAVTFGVRLCGYIVIALLTLDLLGIPIGKLLLGGAAIGIILGVAAQQALANFFASIILIISHPFSVGDNVTINSGALGGQYVGEIKDIGLVHTRLQDADGKAMLLPNSMVLSGAAIIMDPPLKSELRNTDN